MAINYFTKFAETDSNALTDAELQAYLNTGIAYNSVAFSDILNGMFRQLATVTWSVAEFIKDQLDVNVDSESGTFNETFLVDALDSWVATKGYAVNANMPFEKSTAISGGQPVKLQIWWGTQEEYDLLTPNATTLYYIL